MQQVVTEDETRRVRPTQGAEGRYVAHPQRTRTHAVSGVVVGSESKLSDGKLVNLRTVIESRDNGNKNESLVISK